MVALLCMVAAWVDANVPGFLDVLGGDPIVDPTELGRVFGARTFQSAATSERLRGAEKMWALDVRICYEPQVFVHCCGQECPRAGALKMFVKEKLF